MTTMTTFTGKVKNSTQFNLRSKNEEYKSYKTTFF